MRDALESHGAHVETHLYPNRGHADTIASFALVARWRTPSLNQTLAFLQRISGSEARIIEPQRALRGRGT